MLFWETEQHWTVLMTMSKINILSDTWIHIWHLCEEQGRNFWTSFFTRNRL